MDDADIVATSLGSSTKSFGTGSYEGFCPKHCFKVLGNVLTALQIVFLLHQHMSQSQSGFGCCWGSGEFLGLLFEKTFSSTCFRHQWPGVSHLSSMFSPLKKSFDCLHPSDLQRSLNIKRNRLKDLLQLERKTSCKLWLGRRQILLDWVLTLLHECRSRACPLI